MHILLVKSRVTGKFKQYTSGISSQKMHFLYVNKLRSKSKGKTMVYLNITGLYRELLAQQKVKYINKITLHLLLSNKQSNLFNK